MNRVRAALARLWMRRVVHARTCLILDLVNDALRRLTDPPFSDASTRLMLTRNAAGGVPASAATAS